MADKIQLLDFPGAGGKQDSIIKVVGVGGGGCNAVKNMYDEGITDVSFAVANTDKGALEHSPVPHKILLGKGLGAGADPQKGKTEAEQNIEDLRTLFSDGTQLAFITAAMGGGTGTGAGPIVAGVAKEMGILTIGIVTLPFYFEKRKKIIKSLKGVEEMRKNVDALLIINNERLCDVYSDSDLTVKEAFKRADDVVCDATKSISELITVYGTINLDFRDVEATMTGGGGAIMAIGRASGEHRVEKAFIDALDSPLLYGNDISKAKRVLFNIYTSNSSPLVVKEMNEVDSFMDELDPNIEVIWGISDDDSLEGDAKVTILATGLDDSLRPSVEARNAIVDNEDAYYDGLIDELYSKTGKKVAEKPAKPTVSVKEEKNVDEVETQISETKTDPTDNENEKNVEEEEHCNDTQQTVQPQHASFLDRLKLRMKQLTTVLITEDE